MKKNEKVKNKNVSKKNIKLDLDIVELEQKLAPHDQSGGYNGETGAEC